MTPVICHRPSASGHGGLGAELSSYTGTAGECPAYQSFAFGFACVQYLRVSQLGGLRFGQHLGVLVDISGHHYDSHGIPACQVSKPIAHPCNHSQQDFPRAVVMAGRPWPRRPTFFSLPRVNSANNRSPLTLCADGHLMPLVPLPTRPISRPLHAHKQAQWSL